MSALRPEASDLFIQGKRLGRIDGDHLYPVGILHKAFKFVNIHLLRYYEFIENSITPAWVPVYAK
jgi:hypothetical protein